jgi:hypothetical protein
MQVVYDRTRALGFLYSRGEFGIKACDAETRNLGIFPHQRSAADTIFRKELWR